jgi:sigma-B regulation protein RsbU (phosphoserine phosphatase)
MSILVNVDDRLNELESRLETTKAQLRDLATMGAVITSIHEINAVLSVVMDMAIRLVDGEVGLIMLAEDDELRIKVSWGVSEEFIRSLIYQDGMDLPSHCFTIRQTILLNDLGIKDEKGISINSIIALPIQTSNTCYGVMIIINKATGGDYGEQDKEALEMLLNFVAVAIDNSRLMRDKLRQQQIEQEMAIARQIQQTILPQDIDTVPGVEVGALLLPAREVGGDFYDLIRLDEKRFIVVIGDVSSKGVPASLVMSAAAGMIRTLLSSNPKMSVSELAERLNDLLCEGIIKDRDMFVTLFFARFDLSERVLTYCNAGHLPGLFWDEQQRQVYELTQGSTIVGQFSGMKFTPGERRLSSGDRLLLFTDGLTEACDAERNLFGRKRVQQIFATENELAPHEFCREVKKRIDRFVEGAEKDTHDDLAILQVKVK